MLNRQPYLHHAECAFIIRTDWKISPQVSAEVLEMYPSPCYSEVESGWGSNNYTQIMHSFFFLGWWICAFGDVWLKPKKDYIILWRVLRIPGNGSAVSVWEQARWRGRDETRMHEISCSRSRIVHITWLPIAPLMRSLSLAAKGVIAVQSLW